VLTVENLPAGCIRVPSALVEAWVVASGNRCDVFSIDAKGRLYQPKQRLASGYPAVNLRVQSQRRSRVFNIHRLLAAALFSFPVEDSSVIVRHLNDDKTDLRVENIALGSHRDNMQDQARNGGRTAQAHRQSKMVIGTFLEDGSQLLFRSVRAAARTIGTSAGNVSQCLSESRASARGFAFAYAGNKYGDLDVFKEYDRGMRGKHTTCLYINTVGDRLLEYMQSGGLGSWSHEFGREA
jgi:hypothetical protein